MTAILYVIALVWVVAGTSLIVFTDKTRDMFKKVFLTENVKRLSFLPFILGVVLIIGAFSNRDIFWFAFILGLLATSKGIYFYMAPPQQTKALLEWWFNQAKPETMRVFGLIIFVLGVALFSYLR